MKRFINRCLLAIVLFAILESAFAQAPDGGRGGRGGRGGGPPSMLQISTDPGPAAEMVKAALDAFNRRDLDYFRKMLTEDAVWLDDDGHIFASRNQIVNIPLAAELTEATKRKLTPSNMRSGMIGGYRMGNVLL